MTMNKLRMSYSRETLQRRFQTLETVSLNDVSYLVLLDKALPFAAVIHADPADGEGGLRHDVVATLNPGETRGVAMHVSGAWKNADREWLAGVLERIVMAYRDYREVH